MADVAITEPLVSFADIASALGLDQSAIVRRAQRDEWPFVTRAVRGGRKKLFDHRRLPDDVQKALLARTVQARPASSPPAPVAPAAPAAPLKHYQSRTMAARAAFVAEIDRLMQLGATKGKAIATLVELARSGALPPELQALVTVANARAGTSARAKGGRALGRSALYDWCKDVEAARGDMAVLAPAAPAEGGIPAWAGAFLELWARPAKPTITSIVERELPAALPPGVPMPSYDQVRRFVARLDAIARNRGRMGSRALKAMQAYIIRDTSDLWPGAVFVGDGHTFKAEVSHPDHGRPFRPEVTAIIDVFTRRVTGWSVSLAENTWAVADALRHAVTTATCPDIWYYDNGRGANNKLWDDDVTGMLARLHVTKHNSLPWNSQARGVIERLNSTLWHVAAKQLPTYVGPDMDREARQTAFKVTRKDIATVGTSRLLLSWQDFIAFAGREVAAYNARPHSHLPWTVDADSGRRRHQSPDEAWAAAVAAGWTPEPIGAEEARDLFRPSVRRTVQRGRVSLYGNLYGHDALEPLHGEEVLVSFDVHAAARVWVRAHDGRFVCEATWDYHRSSYFPVSAAQAARETRRKGRLGRLDAHRAEVEAEAAGIPMLEHAPAMPMAVVVPEPAPAAGAAVGAAAERAAMPGERPFFRDDVEKVLWLLRNRTAVDGDDRNWLRDAARSHSFRLELEMNGVDAATLATLIGTDQTAEAA